jgi:hypothetical protein
VNVNLRPQAVPISRIPHGFLDPAICQHAVESSRTDPQYLGDLRTLVPPITPSFFWHSDYGYRNPEILTLQAKLMTGFGPELLESDLAQKGWKVNRHRRRAAEAMEAQTSQSAGSCQGFLLGRLFRPQRDHGGQDRHDYYGHVSVVLQVLLGGEPEAPR